MSRILRRPMFRGGRVDSRGTGITSGLMDDTGYADGGRVGFFRGGYSTIPGIDDLSQVGYNPFSFQSITPLQRRQQDIATTNRRNIFSPTIEQIQRNEMRDILGRMTPEQKREMDIRTQAQAEQEDVSTSKFALANPPVSKNTGMGTGTGTGTGKGKGDIDLLYDEEDITRQAKTYEKLLGGEEARSQSIYDALLAAAPAFFKGRTLRETAPQVLESINKSGAFDKPRDIKQAAAQLAIQRKILMDKASAEAKTKEEIVLAGIAGRDKSFEDRIQEVLIRNQGIVSENDLFTAARARLPGFKGKLTTGVKLQPNSIYLSGLTFYETDEQGNLKQTPIIDYRTTKAAPTK